MKDYENFKRIVRDFNEGVNTNDRNLLDRTLDENYVVHNFQGTSQGREAYYEALDEFREAFPDFRVDIEEQVVDDDHVVNRLHFYGTHEGEFAGIPATHQKVETTGISMLKFNGDRISENWIEMNLVGLLGQMGAKPMRPQDC